MSIVLGLAVIAIGLVVRALDHWTDAPIMRQRINAGTGRWKAQQRANRATDSAQLIVLGEASSGGDDDDG